MKCMECGKPLKVTHETIEYRQGGLPGVRLRNIEVRRCSEDGETYEVIPGSKSYMRYWRGPSRPRQRS